MLIGNKLNDAKSLELLQSDYFVRMMLPEAEKKARSYAKEERGFLKKVMKSIKKIKEFNFVIVGAGTLWYIDLVYGKVGKYIAVEPLADIFIPKQVMYVLKFIDKVRVIYKEFGKFELKELGRNNSIFVFHFNILSYIANPIKNINKYLRTGDVIYISTWSNDNEAISVRNEYFNFINSGMNDNEFKIEPDSKLGLCDLDSFPFNELKFYKKHKRLKGKITNILVIYT